MFLRDTLSSKMKERFHLRDGEFDILGSVTEEADMLPKAVGGQYDREKQPHNEKTWVEQQAEKEAALLAKQETGGSLFLLDTGN